MSPQHELYEIAAAAKRRQFQAFDSRMERTISHAYRWRKFRLFFKRSRSLFGCHVWPGHSFVSFELKDGALAARCVYCRKWKP
jgi:predicted cupin superfamily sugar epimerase